MQSKELPNTYFIYETKQCKYIFKNNKTLHVFFHRDDPNFGSNQYAENHTEIECEDVKYLSKRKIVLYKLLGYI